MQEENHDRIIIVNKVERIDGNILNFSKHNQC